MCRQRVFRTLASVGVSGAALPHLSRDVVAERVANCGSKLLTHKDSPDELAEEDGRSAPSVLAGLPA
ncbi:MAG: hypothetical protein J07HX5_00571 [halophilic archaeon J07HX5]|jgi:hypothetical protein|nr:MAG: hypothetical protein J07HX5_00571 [halophilic archaeon J07HX5]